VRVSVSTSSSGNGSCTVATGGDASTSPVNDPVRLLFMAASFRFGLSNHRPYRTAEGAAALLSDRQFNMLRDIPVLRVDSGH